MNMKSNFQDEMNEKSPEEKRVPFSKRTTAKFRSMDLTSQSLNRINCKMQVDKSGQDGTGGRNDKEWGKKQQEMLADLKEASLEGVNSISLSPQRSIMPDLNPNLANKIQTLKKSRIL